MTRGRGTNGLLLAAEDDRGILGGFHERPWKDAEDQYAGGWKTFPEQWPEQVALTREVHDVVASALAELPDRQRVVVALRDLDGLTSEEVCDLLDISAGNQRVLLHRGRAAVRAHLERYLTGQPVPTTRGNR